MPIHSRAPRALVAGAIAAAGLLLLAPIPAARAQFHLGVGGVGSTLGLGGDVTIGLGSHVVLRGAQTVGSIGTNRSLQDQTYDLFAKADNRAYMIDLHPFGGGFYLSAGRVINHSTIRLTGTSTNGEYTFDGQSYAADSVGTLTGRIILPEKPMFFGFGWDHTFGNKWPSSLTSRLGVLHQDRARLDLTASGPYGDASNPNHAAFQAQLDAERTRQEDGLDRGVIRNLPVFEIGMRVRVF